MMRKGAPGSGDSTERRAAILPRWAQLLVECAIAIAVLTIATGLVGLAVLGVVQASAAERYEGQPEIVDADTFRFGGTKVRLWGVDAPESGQTCLDAAGKRYLCGSQAALALPTGLGDGA